MSNSRITLSRNALANNIAFIKSQLKSGVILSSVIKGNAYGHGIAEMVPALEQLDVHHFSVFSSYEAMMVHKAINQPATIMIMGNIAPEHETWVIQNDIDFFVFNFRRLERMTAVAKEHGKKARAHIEVETGMNRTGFDPKDWNKLITELKQNQHIQIVGVCTHFSGAESITNYHRIEQQRKQFKKFNALLTKNEIKPQLRHTACSAGLMAYPKEQWDLVRIGILQYGLWPSRETYISYLTRKKLHVDPLKRLIHWESQIMDVKHVKKQQFIGYGTSLLAESDMCIASVPVGYSDGYSRSLSNQGKVIINETRLDVIGIVNMNMLLIDITNMDDVHIGDPVILIGTAGKADISIASFGELSKQLNYELLTRLDKNIVRTFVD